MSELDQEALRVLELAREARTPTAKDRARLRARLALAGVAAPTVGAQTGPGAAVESAQTGASAAAVTGGKAWLSAGAGAWVLGAVCAAGAMVGGGAVIATMDAERPARAITTLAPAVVVSAPAPVPEPPAAPEVELRAAPEPAAEAQPSVARRAPPAARRAREDTLSEELRLLHRARAAWRRGEAGDALALLKRHRARHVDSAVAAERDALRVLCLCDLGRQGQARRLARRWLRDAPRSPLRSAVTGSCAFE